MAKKRHRKLFRMLATDPNETLDCSLGVCDPSCPYNCYQEPDYYALSPQLPPWSSPSLSPSFSAIYQPSQNPSSSSFDGAITIITVTGAVLFVLLTGFFLVAKFVSDSVSRDDQRRYQSNRDDNDTEEEEQFQDGEQQVDHPIWLIRTTGLQQSIINSITICNYKRGDGLIERTDCPVCLNEFEEEESLRLLPKCNHAFHISCIDTWLRSHTNCPLCRAGIAVTAATPRISGPVDVTPGGSGSNNDGVGGDDLDRGEIENRESEESGFKQSEISGDGSETETKEEVRILGESNGRDSIDFEKSEIENRHIGGEASCSEDRGSSESDIASKSSVSCFNTNKSSVFPL